MNILKLVRLISVQNHLKFAWLPQTASLVTAKDKPIALRSKKNRGPTQLSQHFIDIRHVETIGGKGGDGCVSFLRLWVNDMAGPDGGDGGNGGHVIFQANLNYRDLKHLENLIRADDGGKGMTKDCCGKNADHKIIPVPIGTIVKNSHGKVVGDLSSEGIMFIAARGGAGGHGNHFFVSSTQQAPQIAEIGATGETCDYVLEIKTMAHIGLVGMPNAGKSTLLRAISRARPKVAAYAFTTLKPYIGVVLYDDYEQIFVADLPGLIEGSHRNLGLGIEFLKHAERCLGLLFVIDLSVEKPWQQLELLKFELSQFSQELGSRPYAIIANKFDLPEAQENLQALEEHVDLPVVPISAKTGQNLSSLLDLLRKIYDSNLNK